MQLVVLLRTVSCLSVENTKANHAIISRAFRALINQKGKPFADLFRSPVKEAPMSRSFVSALFRASFRSRRIRFWLDCMFTLHFRNQHRLWQITFIVFSEAELNFLWLVSGQLLLRPEHGRHHIAVSFSVKDSPEALPWIQITVC
jgi:hypothetical protein